MGVQGLFTFVEKHPRIYRDVRFRMSRLVIDGANLIHLLYFDSGLDQNHGGEYAAFEELIERFITALRDCGISPFVVLDGGSDYTDKKLETMMQRAVDRIKKAHRAAVEDSKKNVLPQLAKLMFRQTLARLEVPMAQCYAEADQEIAALANEWQCPVLSNDSDFYIFDLPGFLPISHFQWEAVEQSGSQSYIPCKKYNTSSFCIFFNLERQLLPTFAALAGNDYVKLQKMERPIDWTQFCPAGDGIPSHLEGLLCWLRDFHQPEKALEAALGLMRELSKKKKAEVLQGLYLGMQEYKLPSSALKRFFVHGAAPPFPTFEGVKGLVPDWTRLPLTQARLTSDILDVLLLQRNNLSLPVDHGDMPSINLTSRPLRQVMYGLLLGKGRRLEVNERDRDGLQLKEIPVKPAVRGVAGQLTLESLDQAESSQRLQVLLDALGVTEASLSRLPPQLRLPVAVTCYWLQRAQPCPDQSLLKALLLGLSNGDALRQRAALQMQNERCKQKLSVSVGHAFNQWQACLKDGVYLNQLLGRPLEEPQIARLYEGTLVHDLVHRIRTGKLKQLLKYDRSRVKQYKSMLAIIHQFHSQKASTPASDNQETVTPPRRRRLPLGDLTANLQQLFLLCDDDEEAEMEVSSGVRAQEELHLGDLVSVKTRYRAKERNNRSKNPELARKEECRGDPVRW
ncbi:single-strand DNA endonuclease ASTE1 [Larimichthys crocea]|uniref:single-strand DNA endonuclease ASTE1 n=1 Tax=Larimichthys crocea TaxID=215358 RepID=UPI0009012F56|nr:protein asteroid homolog 1 [Larimichthys crocea]TMS01708.1 Protein asteroid-like protein 1 [Larimichthys crocea]